MLDRPIPKGGYEPDNELDYRIVGSTMVVKLFGSAAVIGLEATEILEQCDTCTGQRNKSLFR